MATGHGPKEQHNAYRQEQSQHRNALPNLAAHFAALTNAVLQRIQTRGAIGDMYDEYLNRSKTKIVKDLKSTYHELYVFYNDQSMKMPAWLAKSPPRKMFLTPEMDIRLQSRVPQLEEDLRAFVEELGFICCEIYFGSGCFNNFLITLQLDVANVRTTAARELIN